MTRSQKIWITAIVVVLAVIAAYFFMRSRRNGTVTLGVIAGTTGQYAAAGEGYMQGFDLALEQWNASHTPKISAIVEDDGFDAQKGVTAYEKLKSVDRVHAYAILSSFTIDAVYDQLHAEGKPVALGFEQTRPAENDNIFQVLPAALPVETALGQKVNQLGYKKPVAAVSNNTAVYQNFYAGFQDGFGGDVPKFEMGDDIAQIRSQALAIVAAKPDVVAFFMAPQDGALLAQEIVRITAASTRPHFVFDQSVQSGIDNYKKVFGKSIGILDGSLVAMSQNDFTPDFTAAFKAKYGENPVFGSDMGYNSFMLLADTYNVNPQTWIANMKSANFTGADGNVSFDSVGLRIPNIFFAKLENGQVIQ
jgi:ABC-type branched-subunit amino acid transport system substrate-binding protein